MLIVEGPDLVGKTHLCKRFVKRLEDYGYTYSHLSRLPDQFDRYWGYIDRAAKFIVQDRFHMSEIVYARARGDETELTPERYRLVDARLRQLGAYTVIVVCNDDKIIAERYCELKEREMYDFNVISQVNKYFTQIARACRWSSKPDVTYYPDFDRVLMITKTQPWVTDSQVETIFQEYVTRQCEHRTIEQRRPRGYTII